MHRLSPVRLSLITLTIVVSTVLSVASGYFGMNVTRAEEPVGVTILAPAFATDPGSDAVFILLVSGDDPASALVHLDVDGGQVMQQLGLSEAEPGLATSTVWIRRDSPGFATLTATAAGRSASASAAFGAGAAVQVALFVQGPEDGAARTWAFEVVDASAAVVSELFTFTSGDAPSATVTSDLLAAGTYTVRPAADDTLTPSCADGGFYELLIPDSGTTTVTLGESGTVVVEFVIAPCPIIAPTATPPAPATSTATAPATVSAQPTSTPGQLVAGETVVAGGSSSPLPPAAGTGSASNGDGFPRWMSFGVLLVMAGASGWMVIQRRPVSTRS
ncbi:MAG TPA: hypothetical protein VFK32_05355 [Tepidiformaceae bacterium]|nr:hypothetical protein [Tepidiformaceae bacterium]